MSNHVIEWLNAYVDGELKGGTIYGIEAGLGWKMSVHIRVKYSESHNTVRVSQTVDIADL